MTAPTVIACGNPSCAARLVVPAHIPATEAIRHHRWRFAMCLGDDCDRIYCPRCLQGENE